MASIRTRLKQFFFVGFGQSSRKGGAQNGQTPCTTATVPQDTITLTQASQAERDSYWKTQPHTSAREQLQEWERRTDICLAGLTEDQQAFLKRLLREPDQRFDTVEVAATALYKTFFQEGEGDMEFFARRLVECNSVAQIQRNLELIGNLARMYGDQTAERVLPLIAALTETQEQPSHTPSSALRDYNTIFSTLGIDVVTGQDVVVSLAERQQALACFGGIGCGKSTLAIHLILNDCRHNIAVVFVEPHGDSTRAVLAGIHESRLPDVVFLDLTDCATFPFSINPFQCDTLEDATEVAKVANFVYHTFSRVWNIGTETPRLSMVLRNVTRILIENPGSSFSDIPLLLHDDAAREKLVKNLKKSPQTKLFWEQYNRLSPRERREMTASFENKIDAYLNEPLIANILSQSKTTIDFAQLLNDGKIVLINLSPQLEEISNLLGSLITGRILMAAYQRASIPESQRVQCNVYIDEWSRFCSDDLSVLIAESRKFKVIIGGLFNQTLETISDSNRATALQAGTLITFRVSGDDSKILSRSYNSSPTPEVVGQQPQRAVPIDVIGYLLHHGSPHPAVSSFTQTYLFSLQEYLRKPRTDSDPYFFASYDNFGGVLDLTEARVRQGYKLLNATLYRCMTDQNPDVHIDPLALYVLALSQGREYSLSAYIIDQSGPMNRMLKGFKEQAKRLGAPSFLKPQEQAYFLKQCPNPKKYRGMSEAVIQMIIDLRHCIQALSKDPVLTDTGLYKPIYRQRTYSDMENQLSNELSSTLQNFHAKVRLPSGEEHTIRTYPAPLLLSDEQVNERIRQIKQRMRDQGICRPAHEVEEEVRLRHERLRQRNDTPPPSHTNRRRRPRPPDHT